MNFKMMGRFNAFVLGFEAVFMLPPLFLCLYDGDGVSALSFLISVVIAAALAGFMGLLSRGAKSGFYAREGLICVGGAWIVLSLVGCLPFFLSGEIPNFMDALFEIVSGFTTTGSSILSDVEALPRGMIYWRSFSHWLGGMGVLVFLLAILPMSSRNSGFTMHLLRAESPGPDVGKLVPRMRQTAMILYLLYIVLTVINVIFLIAGRMPVFDAICTAFGTAGTGGFGIKNDSLAGYSPYLQNVTTVFMLLFGVNFNCFYLLILRHFRSVLRDEELRAYVALVTGSTVLIAVNVFRSGMYGSFGETLRHAAFQVASIITTTGYATTDFDLWPSFSKAILLCLMAVGACAGSTGGGIKVSRVLLLLKGVGRNIRRVLRPQQVQVIRLSGKTVSEKVLDGTQAYLAAYVLIFIVSFLLVSLDTVSMMTGFSAVMACLNNIGPGFEAVGPTCNFGSLSLLSKLVLTLDMLIGRLEIFPILVLFLKDTWKRQ